MQLGEREADGVALFAVELVGAVHQLADQQAGHDGLAGAGVVGEDEAQRLLGQHGLVDGRDLMRQRFDVGGVHRHHRVEQRGLADAVGLQPELEVRAIGIEGPGATGLGQLQARLVGAEQHLLAESALAVAVDDRDGMLAVRLDLDDADDLLGGQAAALGVLVQVFELQHLQVPRWRRQARSALSAALARS